MEFKKLSAVEAVEAVSDTASVLIEENGVIKKAPKDEVGGLKVDELEVVEEPAESANVLIEENGVIKRAPKTAVGGGCGEADLIIRINNHIEGATMYDISIVSGSVEAVYDAFESEKFPIVEVEVVVTPDMNSWVYTAQKIPTQVVFYGDYLYVLFLSPSVYGDQCYSCRISYDSANAYSLSDFRTNRITTTTV